VKHLIDLTLGFCAQRLSKHGTEISVEPFAEQLRFEGRETEISQVILNLIHNASDAIANLPTRWIRIQVLDLNEHIEVRVIDSGSGISESAQKRIFQPFYTTKEIGQGTGLGLSIAAGIVRGHSGELIVDNKSANTCFVLRLPKQQQHNKNPRRTISA
jgi:C4-dicarboxylate-specific signal transduction histidine kinase